MEVYTQQEGFYTAVQMKPLSPAFPAHPPPKAPETCAVSVELHKTGSEDWLQRQVRVP